MSICLLLAAGILQADLSASRQRACGRGDKTTSALSALSARYRLEQSRRVAERGLAFCAAYPLLPILFYRIRLRQNRGAPDLEKYLQEPRQALQRYRHALSLGATSSVPDLYAAAGASFSFDPTTLQAVVELITRAIEELEARIP